MPSFIQFFLKSALVIFSFFQFLHRDNSGREQLMTRGGLWASYGMCLQCVTPSVGMGEICEFPASLTNSLFYLLV